MKNNLEEVLEINPMNNKKYIEAVSFRDWQTCDLICDEHSVLVGRIKQLEQELEIIKLERDEFKKYSTMWFDKKNELEQELQKTREQLIGVTEQLEEKDKEIEEYRLNAIGKMNLEIAHENSELREQLDTCEKLLMRFVPDEKTIQWNQRELDAKQYFKDKDKQGE